MHRNPAVPAQDDHPVLDILGYDAVDIGTLADNWRSEPGTPVYGNACYGEVPKDVSLDKTMEWIFQAPGVPIPADRVRELTATVVRGPAGGSFSVDAWT